MAGFPITLNQMVEHFREFGFITNATLESHLEQMSYVTSANMQQFVNGQLRNEHVALESRLQQSVQDLYDRTAAIHAGLETRVADANSMFEPRQADLASAFEGRDTQLRQHLDATQRANNESLEMIQRGISEHVSAKQQEFDELMAAALANLDSEARRLYQQAVFESRRDTGVQSGGDEHGGKGAGGPRERSLLTLAITRSLTSTPSLLWQPCGAAPRP